MLGGNKCCFFKNVVKLENIFFSEKHESRISKKCLNTERTT